MDENNFFNIQDPDQKKENEKSQKKIAQLEKIENNNELNISDTALTFTIELNELYKTLKLDTIKDLDLLTKENS